MNMKMRALSIVCVYLTLTLLPIEALAFSALSSSSSTSSSSSSVSFSSSSSDSSSTWQQTYDDLNTWNDQLQLQAKELDVQSEDELFQTNADLFPDLSTLSGARVPVLEEKRKERTAAFVSVQIGTDFVVFTDAPSDQWFAPYLRSVTEAGIMSGYKDASGNLTGKFGPADPVTIEQVAKTIVSMIGTSVSACPSVPLNVTASGSWSAPYIACAEKNQWSVYSDGSVDVHRPATRAEVIATVLQAYNITPADASGSTFTDVPPTLQYASFIDQAAHDNIVGGYTNADGSLTGLFGPNDTITRAAFAKIIALAMQVYGKK